MAFSDSIRREISPPEAAPPTAISGWFLLNAQRNSTRSVPVADMSASLTRISTARFFMPNG